MHVLLPPSEGKTAPSSGVPLSLEALSLPALTEPRRQLVEAVDPTLWHAPTAPAWQVYTGVLYRKLDAPSLTDTQRAFLQERVWIASALFGFVGFADPIPAYRLSGDMSVPGIGSLATFWRKSLAPTLQETQGLVLDLRSGIYVKLAPLPRAVAERAVTVRVLQKMPVGPPKLITHFNKATKGELVRALAVAGQALERVDALAEQVAQSGAEVTVVPGAPALLEILLPV